MKIIFILKRVSYTDPTTVTFWLPHDLKALDYIAENIDLICTIIIAPKGGEQ